MAENVNLIKPLVRDLENFFCEATGKVCSSYRLIYFTVHIIVKKFFFYVVVQTNVYGKLSLTVILK